MPTQGMGHGTRLTPDQIMAEKSEDYRVVVGH